MEYKNDWRTLAWIIPALAVTAFLFAFAGHKMWYQAAGDTGEMTMCIVVGIVAFGSIGVLLHALTAPLLK